VRAADTTAVKAFDVQIKRVFASDFDEDIIRDGEARSEKKSRRSGPRPTGLQLTHMVGRFELVGFGEQVLRPSGVGKSEQGLPCRFRGGGAALRWGRSEAIIEIVTP
jgi:hypothetical protein